MTVTISVVFEDLSRNSVFFFEQKWSPKYVIAAYQPSLTITCIMSVMVWTASARYNLIFYFSLIYLYLIPRMMIFSFKIPSSHMISYTKVTCLACLFCSFNLVYFPNTEPIFFNAIFFAFHPLYYTTPPLWFVTVWYFVLSQGFISLFCLLIHRRYFSLPSTRQAWALFFFFCFFFFFAFVLNPCMFQGQQCWFCSFCVSSIFHFTFLATA